jgi:hypothetical protein
MHMKKIAIAVIITIIVVGGTLSLYFYPRKDTIDPCDYNADGTVDQREAEICNKNEKKSNVDGSKDIQKIPAGGFLLTHIHSPENGKIAVRVDLPLTPRYPDGAPMVVMASTWFVEKYDVRRVGFHLEFDPTNVGAISIAHLWPGKQDPQSGIASAGAYDYGGPMSLAALRDTIRFAAGEIPDIDGFYLHELIQINPLYDNVGLFASSHAGVVATNVLAYYGEDLTAIDYFVGRENPTMAEMYPLEIGHFDDRHRPVYNPYYDHTGYTPTSLKIDYTRVGWLQNQKYPEGAPSFAVPSGEDYVWCGKGPFMMGKRWFSHALTQALLDNGAFTEQTWPDTLATPQETKEFWSSRITVHNYPLIGEKLPGLKVMLVFATYDHVQAAPDKPHIRQAYDGFKKRAGLWTRLNPDLSYVQREVHESASRALGFPDNEANCEPDNWYIDAESWGFAGRLAGKMTNKSVPLAGIAEMADRVHTNTWDDNLDGVLIESPQTSVAHRLFFILSVVVQICLIWCI